MIIIIIFSLSIQCVRNAQTQTTTTKKLNFFSQRSTRKITKHKRSKYTHEIHDAANSPIGFDTHHRLSQPARSACEIENLSATCGLRVRVLVRRRRRQTQQQKSAASKHKQRTMLLQLCGNSSLTRLLACLFHVPTSFVRARTNVLFSRSLESTFNERKFKVKVQVERRRGNSLVMCVSDESDLSARARLRNTNNIATCCMRMHFADPACLQTLPKSM